ncbi:MAG: aspartate carbamoyltransferase, partial [Clostridia bacterium]|nr:aspartate carbamoyltransferase [Clostridia bacterium]
MMKKDLIDITDLTTEEIDELIAVAEDILKTPEKYSEVMRHRKIATLFYEPSTRTRFSFESAMLDLGGSVIGFSSPTECSVSKGESVADTARTAACFADVIAMRHFKDGAAFVAASNVDIPVINAGDGGHMHPTQTLTDLFTIHMEKGGFDNLTIGLCGDLKYGRTVHSLIAAMARYKGVKFILISPEELKIPEAVKTDILEAQNLDYVETDNLEEVMPQLDVLYMTRIQQERFRDQAS